MHLFKVYDSILKLAIILSFLVVPICSIIDFFFVFFFFLNLLLFANSNIGLTIIFPFWLYVGMGNEKSNSYWEAELPPNYDRVGIENFIRAKYPLPLLLVSSPFLSSSYLLYCMPFPLCLCFYLLGRIVRYNFLLS